MSAFSRVLLLEFAAVGDYSAKGDLAVNHVASTYSLNGQQSKPLSDLPAMKIAIDEFEAELADNTDLVVDTGKTLPSGQVLVLDPVALTVKFSSAPTISWALAQALRTALVTHGLAPA